MSESEAFEAIVIEPVPTFTKRPGDLVLQGSNNTLISLGQDRGWKFSDDEDIAKSESSNAALLPEIPEHAGSIDIVAGRGRYPPPLPMTAKEEGDKFERTNQRLITNTREEVELMKNPPSLGLDKNSCNHYFS